ncbi:hypothetical protein SNEBB_002872 [Seison nebaliae]|nr:hypothetical protein SNEBB_002872 [Seison nebaliae]
MLKNFFIRKVSSFVVIKNPIPGRVYDPPYINKERTIPVHSDLSISLTGYDYVPLHNFYRYLLKLTKRLNFIVDDHFPIPARTYSINTFKAHGQTINETYELKKYHRLIKLADVEGKDVSLLYEIIATHLPEGISIEIKKNDINEEDFRYVPDVELDTLKGELDEMAIARELSKKKK